jgi:hypothetical protein
VESMRPCKGMKIDGIAQRLMRMGSNKCADELVLKILQLDESSLLVQSVCF